MSDLHSRAIFLRRQARDLRENGCAEALARALELDDEAQRLYPLQLAAAPAPAPVVKAPRVRAPRVRDSRAKIKPATKRTK